jgi:hypothetical protein
MITGMGPNATCVEASTLAAPLALRAAFGYDAAILTFRKSEVATSADLHCRACTVRAAGAARQQRLPRSGSPVVADAGLHDRRVDSNADSNPIDDQSVHQDHHAQSPA